MRKSGWTLHQRITEYKRAIRNEDTPNDLAVQVSKTQNNISWGETNILTKDEHWTKGKIKEALFLREKYNNLKLDQRFQVDIKINSFHILDYDCSLYISSCFHLSFLILCLISILALPDYLFLYIHTYLVSILNKCVVGKEGPRTETL